MSQLDRPFCKTPDFFALYLADGGIRIGMYDKVAISFPPQHALYSRVAAVNANTIEDLFDHLIETGYIPLKYLKG